MDSKYDFTTQELLEAINELPEHHRLVFNLYVIDGFLHKQISEKLNISEGTSKSHLARAKKKLQQILNEKQEEKKNKKSFILILFPCGFGRLKRLYRTNFSDYEITPQNVSFLDNLDWNGIQRPNFSSYFIINGTMAFGIIAMVYDTVFIKPDINNISPLKLKSISLLQLDTIKQQANLLLISNQQTATFPINHIILDENFSKNIKNSETMKKLNFFGRKRK